MKFNIKAIILIGVLFALQPIFSQKTEVQKDINRLLILSGSGDVAVQVINQMADSFKQHYPDVPADFWDSFKEKAKKEDLINLVAPIYEKYYTHDEIKQIIKFYETPVGQKTIKVLPNITQESMIAGQEWGMKLGNQIAKELEEKGYSK